jgi:hypothetical protein
MSDLMVSSVDFDSDLLSFNNVPVKAFVIHGCQSCDWRGGFKCPAYKGFDESVNERDSLPVEGYCKERRDWLVTLTRPYKTPPTYTQWVVDFNKTLAQVQLSKEYSKMQMLESQLDDLTVNDDDYGRIENAKNRIRDRWFLLWKELVRFEDLQVSREMPKKIEVSHTHIPLNQIHDIMRGDVIIDGEVLDEDRKD